MSLKPKPNRCVKTAETDGWDSHRKFFETENKPCSRLEFARRGIIHTHEIFL
jgi:hypothetical protein